jgi:hypothetical protein
MGSRVKGRTFSFPGPNGPAERSVESQHGKTLRLMLETAIENRRHPAGEHGSYASQFCPPGFVPTFMLRWPEHGGNAGDRRLRELVEWGNLKIDLRRYVDASGDETATTMRRLDPASVPEHVLASFGLRRAHAGQSPSPAPAARPLPRGEASTGPLDAPSDDRSSRVDAHGPNPDVGGGIEGPSPAPWPLAPGETAGDKGRSPAEGGEPRPRPSFPSAVSSPATGPLPSPNTQGSRAPRAGEIFLAPHRLEGPLSKEGWRTVRCFPLRDGGALKWEMRWSYSLHLMLDVRNHLLTADQFRELVKGMYRARVKSAPWSKRFLEEICDFARTGGALLYGDHEAEGFRAADVAAALVLAVAQHYGIECRLVEIPQTIEHEERKAS